MRTIQTHPTNSIRFTHYAQMWCNIIHTYKRFHPDSTFKQIAQIFNLSETNARRYYYGIHHYNSAHGDCYTQMREGACVTI